RQAGRLDDAMYVERASMDQQRWLPVADVDPASVPYFSLIVVPGSAPGDAGSPTKGSESLSLGVARREATGGGPAAKGLRAPRESNPASRTTLLVVGLGPGPDRWLTPEAADALAGVDHVVGYAPYVNRVPQREGLQRHASGNTVEVDRARFALELARAGQRVAVVSGGDAGVFGMAAAVFEVADEFPEVDVHVVPGVSAVQAVAAEAGAPIGADFAVISLSDRLKPWSVIERRLHAIGEADLVLAVYNPASRSRVTQVAELQKILLEHRSPDTIVIVGRDVGRAEESLSVTTLAELDADSIDMKCLLIVGASSSRVTETGRVWTPREVKEEGAHG
ncbi:MAG TPA: precorrin-3B C(17)-methyltransferase, partial [Aeromicrobium sp.]